MVAIELLNPLIRSHKIQVIFYLCFIIGFIDWDAYDLIILCIFQSFGGKDQPIMLILPVMLCSSAQIFDVLCLLCSFMLKI